ncbi:MAG: hypothetical protein IPM55_17800 [Acidobacteria bacterium]|nr:hypothetical protein [Acidobacteriota bacterium]
MFINPCDSLNMLYPDATATISLQGLMLFWFDRERRCQIAVLRCDDHDLTFDIFKVPRSSAARRAEKIGIDRQISLDCDIKISAKNSKEEGILSYKDFSTPFDRQDRSPAPDNINDFRWIVNLEGEEFHNRKLEFIEPGKPSIMDILKELFQSQGSDHTHLLPEAKQTAIKELKPMIYVDAGTVYTQAISSEMLLRRDEESRHEMFGRVAYRIGIDIRCEELTISNDSGFNRLLNHSTDFLHVIQITNLCSLKPRPENPELTAGRSDFDLFYDVVRDPVINHKRYDLQGCINPGIPDNPGQDGYPDICIGGYMGESGHFTG